MSLTLIGADQNPESGLKIGELVPAFEPTHLAGPDKGTETCPVCKYGNFPAIQIWHNNEDEKTMGELLNFLESKVSHSNNSLQAFSIGISHSNDAPSEFKKILNEVKGNRVGIAYVSNQSPAIEWYKFNLKSEVRNTIIVYKNRRVVEKLVNLTASQSDLKRLDSAIAKIDIK